MSWVASVSDGSSDSKPEPQRDFYNMLDFAAINVYVLYCSCMDDNIPRRDFMLQRAQELRPEWMASKMAQCVDMTLTNAEEERRMSCRVKAQWKNNQMFAMWKMKKILNI